MGSQDSQIGVATSSSLSGPWIDHGSLNLPQHPTYNLIDPSIYQDSPDDTLYFTFGSYWSGIQQFALPSHEYLMAVDGTQTRSEDIHTIVTNTTVAAAVVEGAVTFKHGGCYYLFFSVGLCCNTPTVGLAAPGDEYRIAVCRAEKVTGPYVDRDGRDCRQSGGSTVLASHGDVYAPGGQGVLGMDDGWDVMYYHYVRPSVGYAADQFFFGWNYLEWREGWPVVV
ncbi:glycoside hydrolase family 43 protein [Didymella exigua CBS 183.55]|uniref:Endo-1,5-alpha-L-arabinanase A n=1 Tax=Didymella exigua CBS 183.55 TaxID=1150837 RepID=A0A6A5R9M8_9PLEO|nr:glycoside hydrolase family 43 protein [Didymella exigua CBS 183.55]KAF1924925.1 glycoside hydrolase family 43 protein [Didymella exigua CBS 183.55]